MSSLQPPRGANQQEQRQRPSGRDGARGATCTAEPAQTPAPRPLRFGLLQRSHPHRPQPTSPRAPKVAASPNQVEYVPKTGEFSPKPCPRAVQYLSGGVRRECAGRWPSHTSLAALRGPRVLSPHRLLGAAIFLPRPVHERGFRCVTSGVGRGSKGLHLDTRGPGPARDCWTESGGRRDFRETRGAREAAGSGRDRSGRRARASAPGLAGVLGPRRESAATGRAGLRNARGRFRGTLGFMLVPESPRGSGSRTKLPPSSQIAVPAVLCSLSGGRTDVLQKNRPLGSATATGVKKHWAELHRNCKQTGSRQEEEAPTPWPSLASLLPLSAEPNSEL
ncbi:uncharacterized protein [Myotis yumanensis]|uniref:uncharacterized protein isoform X2 n=1 Tax=Myotis yumanensis TaxID=159337 RepID=UPI0038D431E1